MIKLNAATKIGFGGGCHWCTEGVFRSIKGVVKVDQGWIGSKGEAETLSEAVIVHFNANKIDLKTLIDIHLQTHACTSEHSMRSKYRSAIYTFENTQIQPAIDILQGFQVHYNKSIVTQVLPFSIFKLNIESQLDYFYSRPNAPFCKQYIYPKLIKLRQNFSEVLDENIISKIN